VFVEQGWDSMIPGLMARKYDVIISSMSITEDRMKQIDFTDKYYNTPSRVVTKKDFNYTGPASLKGKKIGVLKASTQEKYALGELKTVGVDVVSYEAQDQVYLDIKRRPPGRHGSRPCGSDRWLSEQARGQGL
jgi:arginine/ornithine transport system substrate-binding protein